VTAIPPAKSLAFERLLEMLLSPFKAFRDLSYSPASISPEPKRLRSISSGEPFVVSLSVVSS